MSESFNYPDCLVTAEVKITVNYCDKHLQVFPQCVVNHLKEELARKDEEIERLKAEIKNLKERQNKPTKGDINASLDEYYFGSGPRYG